MSNYQTAVETYTPERQPSARADILVPLLSAVITAGLIVATPLSIMLLWPSNRWIAALVGLFFLLSLLAWWEERNVLRRTLWAVERHTGRDLDNDHQIGQPTPTQTGHGMTVNAPSQTTAEDAWWTRFDAWADYAFANGTSILAARRGGFADAEISEYAGLLLDIGLARRARKGNAAGIEFTADSAAELKSKARHWITYVDSPAAASSSSSSAGR